MKINKTKIGYWEAGISILLNCILFAFKLWAGIISHSVAIIADAWHTLSDSFSSLILMMGFKISAKPADERHPFGHGRAEIIFSVIIGTILVVIGFNFLVESIERLQKNEAAVYGLWALAATIVSILSKEFMAQLAFYWSRKTDSDLLKADGWHHRSDALSSLLILAGIFIGRYFWWIDGVLGIMMALFLFYAAFEILKKSISNLIGEKPSTEIKKAIHKLIEKELDFPVNLHHLHIHNYGDHKEVTFHIVLDSAMSLSQAHVIADKLEALLKQKLNLEATIHLEPSDS